MGVVKSDKVIIRKNSTGSDFVRRRANFIEGSNVTLTVSDDPTNNEVDITIASTGGSGSAAGSDTQVQFNDGGTSFGGDAGLTYNKTTDALTVAGNVSITGAAGQATVINEGGADADTRIESDTNANMLFVDASASKIGIGTAAPDDQLHVIGNLKMADADTETKAYRFRTSGSNLDVDFGGAYAYFSTFSGADFTGTQRVFMIMKSDADYIGAYLNWEWKNASDAQQHLIQGSGGVIFNETGADADTRIEGDTDQNLVFVDASTDRVGIGTATPSEKLEVNGNIELAGATDNIKVNGANPKKNVFISAAAMWPSTTAGCATLAKSETGTNDVNYQTLDFDQTTQEYAEFQMVFPDNWDASTVTFYAHWTASAGTGGVAWSLEGLALADDDALDTARGTAVVVTDTLIATGDVHKTAESSAVTLSNTPAAGDLIMFRVSRVTGDAGDTLTGDAKLLGIRIEYGVSAFSA